MGRNFEIKYTSPFKPGDVVVKKASVIGNKGNNVAHYLVEAVSFSRFGCYLIFEGEGISFSCPINEYVKAEHALQFLLEYYKEQVDALEGKMALEEEIADLDREIGFTQEEKK